MNRRFRKLGTFVGLAVLSASISVGLAGCPQTITDNGTKTEVVKIDTNLPLTGDLAVYGTAVKDGATLALEDLQKSDPNSPQERMTFRGFDYFHTLLEDLFVLEEDEQPSNDVHISDTPDLQDEIGRAHV